VSFDSTVRLPTHQFAQSFCHRVLLDDVDVTGKKGGGGYDYYGISNEGTIIVVSGCDTILYVIIWNVYQRINTTQVRPDGYVGTIVPFDKINDLNDYFGSFARISD
jgi:phenol 2-monooxygenase (NADPH)